MPTLKVYILRTIVAMALKVYGKNCEKIFSRKKVAEYFSTPTNTEF